MFFISLASGSSGNSYYLGSEKQGILIDAGIGARTIKKRLKEEGVDISALVAVLLTHDHFDHTRGVQAFAEKYHIPIYATEKVYEGMENNPKVRSIIPTLSKRIIQKDLPFSVGDFKVFPFAVPHDSTDCVGYYIEHECFSFLLATDIGLVTADLEQYISRSQYIVLESNYDKNMLINGPYPPLLKERIMSMHGHLCNDEAADCLARNYHPEMRHIWLCHLSQENNRPDLAIDTFKSIFYLYDIVLGEDIPVETLKRTSSSGCFFLA